MDNGKNTGVNKDNTACYPRPYGRGLLGGGVKKHFDGITQTVSKRKLPLYATVETKAVSRDDGGGWMLEKYNHKLKVMDYKKNKDFLLNNNTEAKEFLENINMSKFCRFFGFFKK